MLKNRQQNPEKKNEDWVSSTIWASHMAQGQIELDSLVKQERELSFEAKLTRLP